MTNEEAIRRLQKMIVWEGGDDITAINMALEALQDQKVGYWRDDGETLWCSVCGGGSEAYYDCYDVPIEFNGGHGWARRLPAFCKRCGAKMEAVK